MKILKKLIKDKIIFVFICILLGIILSIQFKTAESTTGRGVSPREREKELTFEYENVLLEKERLEDELNKLEIETSKYEEVQKSKNSKIKSLYDELEKHKKFAGLASVDGEGIIIEINEPSFQMEVGDEYSIVIANYDLILQLISKLNDLGAEAISINDERYTNYTSLEPTKNSIKINDRVIYMPLKIKAIGNSEAMEKGLQVKGNVMWNMQNKYLYDIKIKKTDNITIKGYNKPIKLKYIDDINEDG